MPLTYPTVTSGTVKAVPGSMSDWAAAKYPVTISNSYIVRKLQFVNDTEQRFIVRNVLMACTLSYSRISGYDASNIINFFQQMRGAYTDSALLNTFSINLAGVVYDWCVFDQDTISPQVDMGELFSFQVKIRQVRPN